MNVGASHTAGPRTGTAADSAIRELHELTKSPGSGLVFFVGAGATSATAPSLEPGALIRGLVGGAARDARLPEHLVLEAQTLEKVGFEMVLNDLSQICPDGVRALFEGLAAIERTVRPNLAHRYLARWVSRGGTVVTTNYDQLIERAMGEVKPPRVRYRSGRPVEAQPDVTFDNWREDLIRGGVLFKVHGSLQAPETCLGALEHVGTALNGPRAELIREVFTSRPVCLIGWRGADPDLPPIVAEALTSRLRDLPAFWVLRNEGSVQRISPVLRNFARTTGVVSDAEQLFSTLGARSSVPAVTRTHNRPSRTNTVRQARVIRRPLQHCSTSGRARLVGITLRRAGRTDAALEALTAAASMAAAEWSAAQQEVALTFWAPGDPAGRAKAHRIVAGVNRLTGQNLLGLGPDHGAPFGELSMAISRLREEPWLMTRLPGLFRRYQKAIEHEQRMGGDAAKVALHLSLLNYQRGRLRSRLAGHRRWPVGRVNSWILGPFRTARRGIDAAGDGVLHARFDVLAGLAVAECVYGECIDARREVPELDRLAELLSDPDRVAYWSVQRQRILARCGDAWAG